MKTDQLLITPQPRPKALLRIGLIASLCLGVSATAFAKKGGGGNPGGGGDDPPPPEPTPAPVTYLLTWLPGDGASSRVYDIDSDGVAVGSYTPGGVYDDRFGVASFPDRSELIDLESLAGAHPDYPAGARLRNGITISDGLIVSGDLEDSGGDRHCYAMQLIDNGPSADPSITWFRVFSAADVGGFAAAGATVYDASENGDLSILTDFDNADDTVSNQGHVWRPADGAPSAATIAGPTTFGSINNSRDVMWGGGLGPVVINADTGDVTELGLYNGQLTNGRDISESGIVVGRGKGAKKKGRRLDQAIRWIDGAWEAFGPSNVASQALIVNAADQVLGTASSQLFLFSDAPEVGYRVVDDLLDSSNDAAALALWDSAGAPGTSRWTFAISDVDSSGFGHICGRRTVNGVERGFILTPIAVP